MKITETGLSGAIVIVPSIFTDERGYFFESFNAESPLDKIVQENESMSREGIFRGMHYQLNPMAQAKLVRVVKGTVIDIALDIRIGSPTYGKYTSVVLSEENKRQFFIPEGFAHGFFVVEDCIMLYKCNNSYSKEHERGISLISVGYSIGSCPMAEKDMKHPLLENCETNFIYQ